MYASSGWYTNVESTHVKVCIPLIQKIQITCGHIRHMHTTCEASCGHTCIDYYTLEMYA